MRHWEPTLPANAPEELGVPELTLLLATDLAVVDHHDGSVWLVANAINFDDTDERVDEAHADAVARLDAMQAALLHPAESAVAVLADVARARARVPLHPRRSSRTPSAPARRRSATATSSRSSSRSASTWTARPSRSTSTACCAPSTRARTCTTCSCRTPTGRDFAVVGSSPETLVKVTSGRVVTFPIAGSRPRGATPDEDRRLQDEVLADPKERAEHIMLVDLSRNDLVKVCEPASVEVVEFMAVKRYSHIMHICSTVVGRLREGATALQTLVATFPAGTLSGAPKPRAIALIDEIEPARRGIYGGTVGYFDFAGDMDMAIAIRTALIRDGRASVQAGGGIVADSVPALEYEESRNKAAAAVRAVQIASRLRRAGRVTRRGRTGRRRPGRGRAAGRAARAWRG